MLALLLTMSAATSVLVMDWTPIAATLLGMTWQWTARAHKAVPGWLGYIAFGVFAGVLWLIATPELDQTFALPNDLNKLRTLASSAYMFFLGVRGAAAMSKDSKAAPATDSR